LLLTLVDLGGCEVAVAAVDRLELAAVDGHHALRQQLEIPAQNHEAAADVADAVTVVVPEVGDGLEVRRQAARQPYQLHVALALVLQATAGLDAMEIAVDVDLEQNRRVVRRPSCTGRCHPFEAQAGEVQFVDKRVDDPNRVVLANEVIQTLWQQRYLLPVLALDVSRHIGSCIRYACEL
jgi:hypothetical protein